MVPFYFPYYKATDGRDFFLHKLEDETLIFGPKKEGAIGLPRGKAKILVRELKKEYRDKKIELLTAKEFVDKQ